MFDDSASPNRFHYDCNPLCRKNQEAHSSYSANIRSSDMILSVHAVLVPSRKYFRIRSIKHTTRLMMDHFKVKALTVIVSRYYIIIYLRVLLWMYSRKSYERRHALFVRTLVAV